MCSTRNRKYIVWGLTLSGAEEMWNHEMITILLIFVNLFSFSLLLHIYQSHAHVCMTQFVFKTSLCDDTYFKILPIFFYFCGEVRKEYSLIFGFFSVHSQIRNWLRSDAVLIEFIFYLNEDSHLRAQYMPSFAYKQRATNKISAWNWRFYHLHKVITFFLSLLQYLRRSEVLTIFNFCAIFVKAKIARQKVSIRSLN